MKARSLHSRNRQDGVPDSSREILCLRLSRFGPSVPCWLPSGFEVSPNCWALDCSGARRIPPEPARGTRAPARARHPWPTVGGTSRSHSIASSAAPGSRCRASPETAIPSKSNRSGPSRGLPYPKSNLSPPHCQGKQGRQFPLARTWAWGSAPSMRDQPAPPANDRRDFSRLRHAHTSSESCAPLHEKILAKTSRLPEAPENRSDVQFVRVPITSLYPGVGKHNLPQLIPS